MIYTFIDSPGGGLTGYIVDDYAGASVAFSVRKIRAAQTLCMRIRRESDNAETDIGFSGDNLDTAAIASHCGASNGRVVKWYDQSGNGNDATQATSTSQPRIYNGSAVYTKNSVVAIFFDNGGTNLSLTSGVNMSGVNWSVYQITSRDAAQRSVFMANSGATGILTPTIATDGNMYAQKASTYYFAAESSTAQVNLNMTLTAGTPTVRKNASAYSLSSGGNSGSDTINAIGQYSSTSFVSGGYGQEFILFASDKSANTAAIETNQNAYFATY